MRLALHLLTIACLLWCALGIAEPAAAQDHPIAQIELNPVDALPDSGNPNPEPGHHQHCPVAPELRGAATPLPALSAAMLTVAPRQRVLASLTHAPPLQPPAA
ncbi:hypothetical protein ABC347_14295 [Sphingomonas sp. 1P06PA]|uniref:hypothetical protein n=1 Tax=Sphingomonas sp. 1P06PA TaxID=554121 RepID=UPI0039A4DD36